MTESSNIRGPRWFNPDPTGISRPVELRPVPFAGVSTPNLAPFKKTPLEIWNEKMIAWVNENRILVESHLIDCGLDWLLGVCAKYGVKNLPTSLVMDSQWQDLGYTAKQKTGSHISGGDKASYVANLTYFDDGSPNVLINFHCYKGGKTTETFSSGALGLVSRFYKSQKENVPLTKDSCSPVPPVHVTCPPPPDFNEKIKKAQNVQRELEIFRLLSKKPFLSNSQDSYLAKKNLNKIVPESRFIRYGADKHGKFVGILLRDARNPDCQGVGVQRFYDRTVFSKDGHPIGNKKFTWGLGGEELKHAYFSLGKVDPHGAVIVCEGFADGIVLRAATSWPVIVALTAGNLESVSQAFHERYPLAKFIIALDNDKDKYDHTNNTGVIKGIQAAQMVGGRFTLPGDYKDFSDLYNALIPNKNVGTFQYLAVRAAIRAGELEPSRKAIAKSESLYGIYSRVEVGAEMALDILDGLKIEGEIPFGNKLPRPLAAIRKMVNRAENAPSGFDWFLTKIAVSGLTNLGNDPLRSLKIAITSAVYAGAQLIPYHKSINQTRSEIQTVIDGIKARIPELTPSQHDELNKHLDDTMKNAVQKVLSKSKCMPGELALSRHNVHVGHYRDYKGSDVERQIEALDRGLVIVKSTHATGKTSSIMKKSAQRAQKAGDNLLFVVPRAALSQDGASVLGTLFYQDFKTKAHIDSLIRSQDDDIGETLGMSICVNSLVTGRFEDLCLRTDTLLIDEIRQVLFHVAIGSVTDENRAILYNRLQTIIRNAKKIIVADADVDDFVIRELEKARPGEKFHIYINTYTHGSKQKLIVYRNRGQFVNAYNDSLKKGINNYVATDSKKEARAFESQAKPFHSSDTVRCITRENTKNSENRILLGNLNNEIKRQNLKQLQTTALSTGVSITIPWFTGHFGYFTGTVSPTDAWQMLRRDRTATEYHVCLSSKRQNLETNLNTILDQIKAANAKSQQILQKGGQQIPQQYYHGDFDRFRSEVIALKNDSKNDFANNFLRLAMLDGIEIEFVGKNMREQKIGNKILKTARVAARDLMYKSIIHAAKLDEAAVNLLLKQNEHTSTESNEITNFMIRENLCVDDISEQDLDFWDDGRGLWRIKLLESVFTPRETLFQLDTLEQNNPNLAYSVMNFHLQKRGLLRHFLDFVGAKIDGSGKIDFTGCQFTAADALRPDQNGKSFVDRILRYRDEFNALGLGVRISEKIRSRPARMIVAVLKSMGIYTKSRQKRTAVVSNSKKMQVVSIAEGGSEGDIDIRFNNEHGLNIGEEFSLVKMKKVENSSYTVKSVIDSHTVRVEGKFVCDSTGFWKKGGQRNHIHYININKSQYALDVILRRVAAGKNFFKKKLSELAPVPAEVFPYPMPTETIELAEPLDELSNLILSELELSSQRSLGIDWLSLVLNTTMETIASRARGILLGTVEIFESAVGIPSISLCTNTPILLYKRIRV